MGHTAGRRQRLSQFISRSAAILRALETHLDGCSVGKIAGMVGLPRSSVHRRLKTLEGEHLVASVAEELGAETARQTTNLRSAGMG
jgi:DNA-binding IclR family transcriptional regulator